MRCRQLNVAAMQLQHLRLKDFWSAIVVDNVIRGSKTFLARYLGVDDAPYRVGRDTIAFCRTLDLQLLIGIDDQNAIDLILPMLFQQKGNGNDDVAGMECCKLFVHSLSDQRMQNRFQTQAFCLIVEYPLA